jgi:sugar-specific transcriptional regulator TrmB
MINTLTTLGFKESDAQIYVFLSREGDRNEADILNALKLYEGQLHRSLKNLQAKGVIVISTEQPVRFSAVPFELVLDLLMKASKERQKALLESREELLSTWQEIKKKDGTPRSSNT